MKSRDVAEHRRYLRCFERAQQSAEPQLMAESFLLSKAPKMAPQ